MQLMQARDRLGQAYVVICYGVLSCTFLCLDRFTVFLCFCASVLFLCTDSLVFLSNLCFFLYGPRCLKYKKLSYRRGTARCVVSVELLPIANSAETTCTTSPEQIEVMKLEGYSGSTCNKHVHSTSGVTVS